MSPWERGASGAFELTGMPHLFRSVPRRVTHAGFSVGRFQHRNPVPDTKPVPPDQCPSPFFNLSFFSYQ